MVQVKFKKTPVNGFHTVLLVNICDFGAGCAGLSPTGAIGQPVSR